MFVLHFGNQFAFAGPKEWTKEQVAARKRTKKNKIKEIQTTTTKIQHKNKSKKHMRAFRCIIHTCARAFAVSHTQTQIYTTNLISLSFTRVMCMRVLHTTHSVFGLVGFACVRYVMITKLMWTIPFAIDSETEYTCISEDHYIFRINVWYRARKFFNRKVWRGTQDFERCTSNQAKKKSRKTNKSIAIHQSLYHKEKQSKKSMTATQTLFPWR